MVLRIPDPNGYLMAIQKKDLMKNSLVMACSLTFAASAFAQSNDTLWHDIWGGTGPKDADLTKSWSGLTSIWTVRYPNTDSAEIYGNGSPPTSAHTFLLYKTPLLDFEVEAMQRLPGSTTNSGLQMRSVCANPGDAFPCGATYTVYGPQADVGATHNGELYNEQVGPLVNVNTTPAVGNNYVSSVTACRQTQKPFPQWNLTRARVQGNKITGYLNDTKCYEYTIGASQTDWLKAGYFGMQYHGAGGTVEYRTIRLKLLSAPTSASAAPSPMAAGFRLKAEGGRRTFTFAVDAPGNYTLTVADLSGRVAKRLAGIGPVPEGRIAMEKPGVYWVRIRSSVGESMRKIFIN
jgi:hypothetical protein